MRINRTYLTLLVLLLVFFTGCAGRKSAGREATDNGPKFTEIVSSTGVPLGSLRQLDSFPLYELRYKASYSLAETLIPPERKHGNFFACTCIAAVDGRGHRILGRNFDWYRHPALVLHTAPSNGFASISLVDISYLGYAAESSLTDAPDRLIEAPFLPFDGMNEKGLAVGMMAVDSADSGLDPAKTTVDELLLIRLMLDGAADVAEAVAIAAAYNIDFGNVPIHYLVTDSRGASAILEFAGGRLVVTKPRQSWQISTNFIFAGLDSFAGRCPRFDAASLELERSRGTLVAPFNLLEAVSQENTIWSSLYDLESKSLNLVMDRQWGRPYKFSL